MENQPIVTINNLHVCLSVANLDKSIKWYQQVLGFKILQEQNFPELMAKVVFLESHGVEIELVERKDSTPFRRPDPPQDHVKTQGVTQLSFRVNNIEEVYERVKGKSIPIVLELVNAEPLKFKAFFIRDNEGNLIEFIERY